MILLRSVEMVSPIKGKIKSAGSPSSISLHASLYVLYISAYCFLLALLSKLSFILADVVPVVRCKDCKFYKKINYDDIIPNTCDITTRRQQPYDYCSYGERRC